jgi:hypothetical protein
MEKEQLSSLGSVNSNERNVVPIEVLKEQQSGKSCVVSRSGFNNFTLSEEAKARALHEKALWDSIFKKYDEEYRTKVPAVFTSEEQALIEETDRITTELCLAQEEEFRKYAEEREQIDMEFYEQQEEELRKYAEAMEQITTPEDLEREIAFNDAINNIRLQGEANNLSQKEIDKQVLAYIENTLWSNKKSD